ncbi:electron transfer flavoprotein-ubiquinone oxidoreductase [Vibrio navarrensis]|uniref:Electron transfer flavoprotein-ubiquinone oxidoreductase n=1 Tax=Vibrio navarrensis TaxID=29495 RepID=A0A099LWM4_9VIBR|nr:electron transfer flavoprotein-ubiquinone oxidoreductase [Vibrio navarrensis]KGK11677.1 electron transfer flavoprotein-ubiquinone oxidoreductase [Vibrio navarrensis]MBE4615578.1 electron transfer flavoprotein-ubiquinone oxidoreductase [Vibrio navarrensis]QOD67809.1 electron transfer flavoprotein-ubiquinone oxidoreductase [Vibrio navarrensis]
MERETMGFDVVIVGAGPAGLSAACKLAQLSQQHQTNMSICVVEKGSQVGAHILSGALFETTALDELFPHWQKMDAPLKTTVKSDDFLYLATEHNHIRLPHFLTPKTMHNASSNYVISLAELCRWLASQAEQLGVEIFPGFAAASVNYDDNGAVIGVITSDMGRDKQGEPKANFESGIALNAKYTLFAEGARGHLGKDLIQHFELDKDKQPQHYALGIKEIWQLADDHPHYQAGNVLHGLGWPLNETHTTGGSFLYHLDNHQIAVGLITDLSYHNPYLSPFDEFQRLKHHPAISKYLRGGQRIAYGARAIAKGGLYSLPKQQFPGGLLIGCDAGTLNFAKIKGCHSAMKSGLLAAQAVFDCVQAGKRHSEPDYDSLFRASWLYRELENAQNFCATIHRYGNVAGGVINSFEQNVWVPLFKRPAPWEMEAPHHDHLRLLDISHCEPIAYPKPDGVLSFDKPSSVYLSGARHEENQPCHLRLADASIPIQIHLEKFAEPAQRYCPAGVYEVVQVDGESRFQINAANCVHCKTCDIKDPSQNITWVPPEGGGGPNYSNM